MTTLNEYARMLLRHDWYYAMSDSHGVYQMGAASMRTLLDVAKTSEQHTEMLHAGMAYFRPDADRAQGVAERFATALVGEEDAPSMIEVSPRNPNRYEINFAKVLGILNSRD